MFSLSYGMPLSWRKQAHRPPGPFVEDEVDSLCRELDGSSHIGELSGFEGAKARGTVNQSPLILDIDTVHAPINAPENSSHDDERSPSGYRPSGFDANHHVPKTDSRQGPKQDPIRRPAGENLSQGPEKPRSKSPPRSQDTPSMSQTSRFAHTQIPDIPGSFPSTSQRPIPREPESASRAPAPHDALPPKLPPKPKQYMAEKSETVPSRAPSLPRGQEQRPSASPTRYTQPEPVRVRTSSPAKTMPEMTERRPPAHSRTPSLPRGQEQYTTSSSIRYEQQEPVRVRMSSPAKSTPDVTEKSHTAHPRTPSVPRVQEQQKLGPPTRPTQSDPIRNLSLGTTVPTKPMSEMTEKRQTVSTSVPREREQQNSNSPTVYAHPERAQVAVKTSSPPKPVPDVAQTSQSVPSRTPSVRGDRNDQNTITATVRQRSESARDSSVWAGSLPPQPAYRSPAVPQESQNRPLPTGPPQPVSGQAGHARSGSLPPKPTFGVAPPQTFPSRPPPVPQPVQNRPLPTVLPQPAPIRDTSVRGPALPPKPMHEVTRQSQPTIPRPLPTPPDDEPCRPRPTSVPYQLETVVRDSGVRVEMLPPRSMPEAPQATQRPISVVSDEAQFKSFPSVIPPPRSLSETPPTLNTIPLQSMPLRSIPLHPLPNPPAEGPRLPSSAVKESSNLKQATSSTSTTDPRPNISGYMSGTAHTRPSHVPRPSNDTSARPVGRDSPPPGLTVAERLEEKLKYRREQREVPDTTQTASAPTQSDKSKTSDASASQSSERVGRSAQLPGAWPSDSPSEHFSSRLTQFPNLEPSSGEKKETSSQAKPPLKSALRSRSLDRSEPAATKAARRRTVAFAENPLEYPSQALVKVDHETALARSQDSDSDSNRSSSPNTGLTLSPCPRSIPVAGYQDWYTIDGLNHLDICPSCVKQMRKSKFRDRLVLATPKPRSEPISCAMSEPWTRLAWMQTLKKKFESLDLLLEVTRPSHTQGPKSCTGRTINKQHWYRIIDPETGSYLPQFNVCSACVRNLRLLMPVHRETFQRSTAPQERVCDFVSDSPRFIRYIDALDLASNRAEQDDTPPDLREFLAYARRKVVLRDCRRSRLIFDKWHYMPQLPEFTVCEDCYDDIVWPLSKARHPIAKDFSSVMRLLPTDTSSTTPSSSREASCQLYSPRIRAKFNDAVRRDDLPFIKWMAITRFEAERRFRYRQDELLEDQRRGYDCSQDLRKNLEDWKRYE